MASVGPGFDPLAAERAPDAPTKPPAASVHEALRRVFDEDFQWCLRDNPEWASQAGFNQYDDKLQDLSPASFEGRIEHNNAVLAQLEALELSDASVTDSDRLQAQLLKAAVEDESKAYGLGCHLMCLNSTGMGGVFESFIECLDWMRFESEEDMKKYLSRIMAVHEQTGQWCDLLAYGAMRGITCTRSMMRNVPSRLQELLDSDLSVLRKPLEGQGLDAEAMETFDKAIENCFRASIRRFQDFLNGFYNGRVRDAPGCCALPEGKALYSHCLRFHTTTDKSAEELHNLGLSEVARLEARFRSDVLDKVGFKGTLSEFAETLKEDASQYFGTVEELLDGYRTRMAEIEALLPTYFPVIPTIPLEIVEMKNGPGAFYMAGTPDGRRPGRFFVNTSRLSERGKYEMMALALHEGVPGHHFQSGIALQNDTLPDFFRYIEDRRYEFGPGRRPMYAAYFEGWALYCERLGEEMGLYKTPQDLFGRLSCEMMRAARLVVDTGIHEYGWSIEQAVDYFEEKTGMHRGKAEQEIHRYAAWPGQACAYKVGQLAIEEMRTEAEAALAEKFDLPGFHQVLLGSGPMPLNILAELVRAWVKSKQE